MSNEELLNRANRIINELFGTKQRRTRGPDSCMRLYHVDYCSNLETGEREGKVFKHKKNAQAYLKTIQHKPKVNFRRVPYDCYFIATEGIEEMYKEYQIEDWSLEEFKEYVEYHKKF